MHVNFIHILYTFIHIHAHSTRSVIVGHDNGSETGGDNGGDVGEIGSDRGADGTGRVGLDTFHARDAFATGNGGCTVG